MDMSVFKKQNDIEQAYVYIFEFKLLGTDTGEYQLVYKVGVTKHQPIDRMLQVARSFFQKHRYIPECRLVKFKKYSEAYNLEAQIHQLLKPDQCNFTTKFDGSSEFFYTTKETVIHAYLEIVDD